MVPFMFIKKGASYQYCEDSILYLSFLSSLSLSCIMDVGNRMWVVYGKASRYEWELRKTCYDETGLCSQ